MSEGEKSLNKSGPNTAPIVFIEDYASDAIKATGGMDVWMKSKRLELDCIVTFFQPDDSLYMTEHHFEVYPWSNSILISAQEPLSRFVWSAIGGSQGRFNVLEGDEKYDVLPGIISYRDYAEAVLNLVTAPVRFLDEPVGFTKEPAPVRMEGRWYYPIERTYPELVGSMPDTRYSTSIEHRESSNFPKVVFFQNRDPAKDGLVDMVWFADIEQKKFLSVRGYDYKQVHSVREQSASKIWVDGIFSNGVKDGVLVPSKIEIFRTDARTVITERLVKIDFK